MLWIHNIVKNKIIYNFVKFVATEKGKMTNFPPSCFAAFDGSEIRDPKSEIDKNQDP
jgi:hypothetical protein